MLIDIDELAGALEQPRFIAALVLVGGGKAVENAEVLVAEIRTVGFQVEAFNDKGKAIVGKLEFGHGQTQIFAAERQKYSLAASSGYSAGSQNFTMCVALLKLGDCRSATVDDWGSSMPRIMTLGWAPDSPE